MVNEFSEACLTTWQIIIMLSILIKIRTTIITFSYLSSKLGWNNYCNTHYFTNENMYPKHPQCIFWEEGFQEHSRVNLISFSMPKFVHIQPKVSENNLILSN
jgi:hypothetical protein